MRTTTDSARRSALVAQAAVLLGLLALWLGQPLLPVWACGASLPAFCPPFVLPFRTSLISSVTLFALLMVLLVTYGSSSVPPQRLMSVSRSALVAVPVILVLTAISHFVLPQP
jgi:hypothetical protein